MALKHRASLARLDVTLTARSVVRNPVIIRPVVSCSFPLRRSSTQPQNDFRPLPPLKPTRSAPTAQELTLSSLVAHAVNGDRTAALGALADFLTLYKINLSPEIMTVFIELFTNVFDTSLPFTVLRLGYRQIFFDPSPCPEDVNLCYGLLPYVNIYSPEYPDAFLRVLVRRLASASPDDRTNAKTAVMSLSSSFSRQLLHLLAIMLSPGPPHGVDLALDCVAELLDLCPAFDARLWVELELAFRGLHLMPHLHNFHSNLIIALKALEKKDGQIAHRFRRFLLNSWPRMDPHRAVMFMHEATAICTGGPPLEEFVWQRLSWRSSSIQWQLATEGMAFVEQTLGRMNGVSNSVLRHLLEEAAATHWSLNVRCRAREVLEMIGDVVPVAPKLLQMGTWRKVRDLARGGYPEANFNPLTMRK
jgi:hypothetical protein